MIILLDRANHFLRKHFSHYIIFFCGSQDKKTMTLPLNSVSAKTGQLNIARVAVRVAIRFPKQQKTEAIASVFCL
jgi:hypothetical protein